MNLINRASLCKTHKHPLHRINGLCRTVYFVYLLFIAQISQTYKIVYIFSVSQGALEEQKPWWKANFFVTEPVLFGTWDGENIFYSNQIGVIYPPFVPPFACERLVRLPSFASICKLSSQL